MDQQEMNAKAAVNAQGMQGPAITADAIKNAQQIRCECGGILFQEKVTFKKISSILSPTGRDEIVPMPVIVCDNCGLVPAAFDPQGLVPPELRTVKPEPKMEVKK